MRGCAKSGFFFARRISKAARAEKATKSELMTEASGQPRNYFLNARPAISISLAHFDVMLMGTSRAAGTGGVGNFGFDLMKFFAVMKNISICKFLVHY